MGVKHEAATGEVTGASGVKTEVEPAKSGTLETSAGPITWTREKDGTLNAEGGGQNLTVTGTGESDGSWQSHSVFSRGGADPYLTMHAAIKNTERSAGTTLEAGQSRLTLAIPHIGFTLTTETATVSGTLAGSAVNWTGPVDLTSNPLIAGAVPGWPQGAFAAEQQEAAFFIPLAKALTPQTTGAHPGGGATGAGGGHVAEGAFGGVGRAGAWCVGGAIAGSAAGPETLGLSMLAGCSGGATASLLNDLVTYLDEPDVEQDPLPVVDFPDDPIDTGPSTQTQPDDAPPDSPGGGSGGWKPDDDGPGLEEA
jgi:hypothetical protein